MHFSALQHVKDYKPPTEGQHIRILLHGPVGAGKSSFINSVQSVLRGRIYRQALADNVESTSTSFTRKFRTYKIPKEGGQSFYPFVLNDMMGLEIRDGVLVDDVKLALRGHVRDGYKFNPESKLSEDDPFYNKNPSTNDKVHVLVLVIDANTMSMISDESVQRFRDIRMEARDLGENRILFVFSVFLIDRAVYDPDVVLVSIQQSLPVAVCNFMMRETAAVFMSLIVCFILFSCRNSSSGHFHQNR
uniref:Uncharacterized protein n=1 Tax=Sparus aurata TaxID=8175 RepID=A0A671TX70_SPAAU